MWDKLRKQIAVERTDLRKHLLQYELLGQKCAATAPDPVELSAFAVLLHGFYGGVENIFKRVVVELNEGLPTGHAWHKLLLASMTRPGPERPVVISPPLGKTLEEYLKFRHFFRGAYPFQLRWAEMAPLVNECQQVFAQFEAELDIFLAATKDRK